MQEVQFHHFRIDCGSRQEVAQRLRNYLVEPHFHQVVTVNPEYIVLAKRYPELHEITQKANLTLVDGVGLRFALFRSAPVERYTGADAVYELCEHAELSSQSVGIILRPGGLSSSAVVQMSFQKLFPKLEVHIWENQNQALQDLKVRTVAILLVALGQPEQDVWINEHRTELASVRLAMGVGGSIDFLTGQRKRAPRVLRSLGLEWLWRMVTQPKRLPRIFRATFGFWFTLLTHD